MRADYCHNRVTFFDKRRADLQARGNIRAAMSSTKILIIEDEQDVIDLLTLHFRKVGGFIVTTAIDGATGLRKAREELPALIILDLMLPKMPGLEICKVLKTDPGTRQI